MRVYQFRHIREAPGIVAASTCTTAEVGRAPAPAPIPRSGDARVSRTTDVESSVLANSTAFLVLGVCLLAWLGVSLVTILSRGTYELGARHEAYAGGPMRGSRAERRLLRRAASRSRTEIGKWRRIVALSELAHIRHPACRTLLPAALAERDDELAGAGVRSLGEIGTDWAAALLLDALGDGSHPRSRVASQLERFAPRLGDDLARLLEHDDAGVRYWAATLLARYEDAPADGLSALVRDPDQNVRGAAIETLGLLGLRSSRPAVAAALDDESWVVRLHACRALGRIGTKREAPRIARLLGDRQWWVRSAAKDSLRALAPRSLGALRAALDDDDEFARNGAAEVFQDLGIVDELLRTGADPVLLRTILGAGGPALRSSALARDAESDAATLTVAA